MKINKLPVVLRHLANRVGKKDLPISWVELLLLVSSYGDEGITSVDAYKKLGIGQGMLSHMVKKMSIYFDEISNKTRGYDILRTEQDLVHRHRQRIFLSDKGKTIMDEITEMWNSG